MRLALFAAAAAAVAAPPAAAKGPAAPAQLAYTVSAPKDAAYALQCRFRAVKVGGQLGGALANSITLSGKGPQKGRLPSDNARCTLEQTGDQGPIGVAVVKDKAYTAGVARRGQSAKLLVP